MVSRISSRITAGSQANATLDIKKLVVEGICAESILQDGFGTSNLGARFEKDGSHGLLYVETIRDACAQMVEKNGDVIASAFGGNFPDLAGLTCYGTKRVSRRICVMVKQRRTY